TARRPPPAATRSPARGAPRARPPRPPPHVPRGPRARPRPPHRPPEPALPCLLRRPRLPRLPKTPTDWSSRILPVEALQSMRVMFATPCYISAVSINYVASIFNLTCHGMRPGLPSLLHLHTPSLNPPPPTT